jgi:membrane protein
MKAVWNWVKTTRAYQAWDNYSKAGGNLLAAGMSFQMLFASFAGVWVLFAVANGFFDKKPEVRAAVIDFINNQVPGLIDSNGPIYPELLMQSSSMTLSGIAALIATAWTAVGWLSYSRVAIRSTFGLPPMTNVHPVLLKTFDLGLAIAYGLLVLVSAVASVIATQAIDDVCEAFGLSSNNHALFTALQVLGILIVLALDTFILGAMIRLLSGLDIPWRQVVGGALLGGAALGVIKIFATVFISHSSDNPLFASVALFIGILVWYNLSCRVFLLSASWVAMSIRRHRIEPADVGWVFRQRA